MSTQARNKGPARGPAVFDADDPAVTPTPAGVASSGAGRTSAGAGSEPGKGARETRPRDDDAEVDDDFSSGAVEDPDRPGAQASGGGRTLIGWGGLLLSVFVGLAMLAFGVWFARFVSVALDRTDWVGAVAWTLLALGAVAALVLVAGEVIGFVRLARIGRLRREADALLATPDRKREEALARRLRALASGRAETRWDVQRFREEERHAKEEGALLALADRVLLQHPDREARRIIFESARRVAVVTAVVPVAALVVLFVLVENVRMLRRLAGAYGGRPGMVGGLRLAWRVIAHIAATGAIALTDDLFGQFLGQDIVRRVSRRLGEGAFNGALTARLGVAALDICRPLPFIAAKPIRTRGIVRELFPQFNAGDMVRGVLGRKRPPAAGG